MKYTIETLANKINAQFSYEYDGFKLNDYEAVFDDIICFVSGVLQDGEIIIYDIIESLENEETRNFTGAELSLLMNLIN